MSSAILTCSLRTNPASSSRWIAREAVERSRSIDAALSVAGGSIALALRHRASPTPARDST
jgi:hypothetical protein